jgi:probable 2-oxoglutarate dehydrogenase E1 component DHKTD1
MGPGTKFKPVIDDGHLNAGDVQRVVLVSGKLYYDLVKTRAQRGLEAKIALVRLEELCPFPFQVLEETLGRYTKAEQVFWVQEEPRNQGSYTHIAPRVATVLDNLNMRPLVYKGRMESAVPAPGSGKVYQVEQAAVLDGAFESL